MGDHRPSVRRVQHGNSPISPVQSPPAPRPRRHRGRGRGRCSGRRRRRRPGWRHRHRGQRPGGHPGGRRRRLEARHPRRRAGIGIAIPPAAAAPVGNPARSSHCRDRHRHAAPSAAHPLDKPGSLRGPAASRGVRRPDDGKPRTPPAGASCGSRAGWTGDRPFGAHLRTHIGGRRGECRRSIRPALPRDGVPSRRHQRAMAMHRVAARLTRSRTGSIRLATGITRPAASPEEWARRPQSSRVSRVAVAPLVRFAGTTRALGASRRPGVHERARWFTGTRPLARRGRRRWTAHRRA